MSLITLDLRADCDLFPINVPMIMDARAASDRGEKYKITALAQELLANQNALVIGDGIKLDDPRVKTFQAAKGLNGLEQHEIHIFLTWLNPICRVECHWPVVEIARSYDPLL